MTFHEVDVYVGKRVRLRRAMMSMTQDDLGKAIGVTFQQIQKYEKGSNRISSSRLYDISKVLTVPVSYFFEKFSEEEIGRASGFAEDASYSIDSAETQELLDAFYSIPSTTVRKKILGLIRVIPTSS